MGNNISRNDNKISTFNEVHADSLLKSKVAKYGGPIDENRNIENLTADKKERYRMKCYGCEISNNLVAVLFAASYITYYPASENAVCISFDFGGCYMAKYKYCGNWYTSHISTGSGEGDCKDQWNNFISDNNTSIEDLILFRPMTHQMSNYDPSNHFSCGLIDDHTCYNLLLSKSNYRAVKFKECGGMVERSIPQS